MRPETIGVLATGSMSVLLFILYWQRRKVGDID